MNIKINIKDSLTVELSNNNKTLLIKDSSKIIFQYKTKTELYLSIQKSLRVDYL